MVYGLNVEITDNGTELYSYCLVRKQKAKVHIDSFDNQIFTERLFEQINSKYPLCLNIDGKGVLVKPLSRTKSSDRIEDIKNTFPTIDLTQFYYQIQPLDQQRDIIAICRKETVDNLFNLFTNRGFHITNISFCFFPVFSIQSAIGSALIKLPQWQLSLAQGTITHYEKSISVAEDYDIDGDRINSCTVLPYSATISFFLPAVDAGRTNINRLKLNDSYFFSQLIRKTILAGLGLILVLLLINYFVFANLSTNNQKLEANLELNEQLLEQIDKLNAKKMANSAIKNDEQTRFSYYADRVAMCMPQRLKMTKMEFSPVKKNKRSTDILYYESSTLVIAGQEFQGGNLNEWIDRLKIEKWIKSIEISKYEMDSDSKCSKFELIIKI